jgi:glutamyl-tRNA synthetase
MKFTTGNTVVTFDKMWYLQKAFAGKYAAVSNEDQDAPEMDMMINPIEVVLNENNLLGVDGFILGDLRKTRGYISKLVRADARNYTTAREFVERNKFFFEKPDRATLQATKPLFKLHKVPQPLLIDIPILEVEQAVSSLKDLAAEKWKSAILREQVSTIVANKTEDCLRNFDESNSEISAVRIAVTKAWSKLIHNYLRWALLAGKPGPDGGDIMDILGKTEVLSRLQMAVSTT